MPAPLIRPVTEEDASAILRIYEPFCQGNCPVSFEIQPPTLDEIRARIRKITAQYPWLVWEESGTVLGYVYASTHRERAAYAWGADVTVYLDPTRRRAGLGRKMYSVLFELLKLQNICMVYAGITLPNPGSEGLHEKMGFTRAGLYRGEGFKGGNWHDVGWFELELQRPAVPAPVIPFSEVVKSPRVKEILSQISTLGV